MGSEARRKRRVRPDQQKAISAGIISAVNQRIVVKSSAYSAAAL
jgi:hypothetical protein